MNATAENNQVQYGTRLNIDHVLAIPTEAPDHLKLWQNDTHGPGSILRAVYDIQDGKTVRFAICDRQGREAPVVQKVVTWACLPGFVCIRNCSGGKPDAAGSSAFMGSREIEGSAKDLNSVEIAAAMAHTLASQSPLYFRLK